MKERPILFSTPMVQAILKGRKTMTRRAMNPQPVKFDPKLPISMSAFTDMLNAEIKTGRSHIYTKGPLSGYSGPKEKYSVGDILWVREMHYRYGKWTKNGTTKTGKQKWKFLPDRGFPEVRFFENPPDKIEKNTFRGTGWYKRSSLFMPRQICRIRLLIKSIRVERLQDITEEDAIKEGAKHGRYLGLGQVMGSVREGFFELWDTIKGSDSVFSNPWVWVIEFEKI